MELKRRVAMRFRKASGTSACMPTVLGALRKLAAAPPCALEVTESLEQLRALWLGLEIRVALARELLGPDVDTPEDLHRAAEFLRREGVET